MTLLPTMAGCGGPEFEPVYIRWALAVHRLAPAKARGDFGGMVVWELRQRPAAARVRKALRWCGATEEQIEEWMAASLAERREAIAAQEEREREAWDVRRRELEIWQEMAAAEAALPISEEDARWIRILAGEGYVA
ncbi:MAG: hypothetical protein AB7F35_30180 [Acetobacteraceae bacterium]